MNLRSRYKPSILTVANSTTKQCILSTSYIYLSAMLDGFLLKISLLPTPFVPLSPFSLRAISPFSLF